MSPVCLSFYAKLRVFASLIIKLYEDLPSPFYMAGTVPASGESMVGRKGPCSRGVSSRASYEAVEKEVEAPERRGIGEAGGANSTSQSEIPGAGRGGMGMPQTEHKVETR